MKKLINILNLFFMAFAFWLIYKEIKKEGLENIIALLKATPFYIMLFSFLLGISDYLVLGCYDIISILHIKLKIKKLFVLLVGALSFGISNTAGHSYASGGAVRFLFYNHQNLSKLEIIKIIAFTTLGFFIGTLFVFLLAIFLMPLENVLKSYSHIHLLYGIGFGVLMGFFIYLYLLSKSKNEIIVHHIKIIPPKIKETFHQCLIGFIDGILSFLSFYVILNYHLHIPLILLFIIFMVALNMGTFSQIPGGLGIIEATILLMLGNFTPQKGEILASLVIYRCTYYFIPFFISCLCIGIKALKKDKQAR